ncbi:class I SAM-dependent methyltransferase [Shewanella avicenniae]|uniref:Class I SAM-dependent methyltransferase n=1 Tax=Shewanella avicenniae TaxID=2814294 RepID=A0ABX7QRS3_9GAMM|nr:class I SAM-dependent methyltransferase [Shewanella avicenniae]QSX34152.1 class I SAM-dependent methyltransferase [Shewanella avicenniae]
MWDEIFNSDRYVYGTEPNQFLAENVQQLPKGKVLCLADGEGRNSVFLAKQGYQVTAVDLSKVGLEKAAKLAASQGVAVEYIHADLAEFEFGTEQWDAIVSVFCHLPSSLRQQVHQRALQGLKPNGVFLLEGYTPRQLAFGTGGPKMLDLLMEPDAIAAEFAEANILQLAEIERDIIEGDKHTGTGAVVQLIAKR